MVSGKLVCSPQSQTFSCMVCLDDFARLVYSCFVCIAQLSSYVLCTCIMLNVYKITFCTVLPKLHIKNGCYHSFKAHIVLSVEPLVENFTWEPMVVAHFTMKLAPSSGCHVNKTSTFLSLLIYMYINFM